MLVRRLLSPPVIVGALLVVAVAIAGDFITNPLPIDTAVWSNFIESRSPAMNTFMTGASWLYVLSSVVLSAANSFVIKHLYERPRPEEAYRLITEDGYSFPSGHATVVTALVVSLVMVMTMTRVGREIRHLLWVAAVVFIAFICVTRLYLGVHWVTDVLGGCSVGLGSTLILSPFMLRPNALRWVR